MELKDLVGKHILSGVDMVTMPPDNQYSPESEVISFVLDNITYTATEDPEDGYRSCMASITVSQTRVVNNFTGQEVLAVMREPDNTSYDRDEVLDLYDTKTGRIVLSVGTIDVGDYYPVWVAKFMPENMAINKPNA